MKEKELHRGVVPFLNCKDHLVSKETYEIMLNEQKEMLVTSPIPSDLHKYYDSEEYQSHHNSKKTFLNFIYNTVKKQSFKRKRRLFQNGKPNKTLLDIGAGTGDFLLYCKENKFDVTGVEPSKSARNIAKEKGIELYEELKEVLDRKFDVITMWHVLEHVPNLYEYLEQLKTLLNENGKLIIAVPNFKSYDAEYYKEFWAAYDVPRHLWHFSKKSIHTLFESVQMKVTKVHPLKFDSFYVSLLSEKNKTGKTNYLKAFWVGLKSNMKASQTKEYSSLIYELKHS
ncbi:class I SAM-dependent methyltransferase [Pseudotenacibaculum sp. MALMAid0570]|uniref:class I SAM-dependent methyltransferase n=1 Tax=Pseudotenacibaculum sp. MALMAid0570 TaxID=3143938 RepID=UPI0032E02135